MSHVSMTVMMMILLAGGATIEGVGDRISDGNRDKDKTAEWPLQT